jgi:hypothetical protein
MQVCILHISKGLQAIPDFDYMCLCLMLFVRSLLQGLTLIYAPLTIASLGRRLWINIKWVWQAT